MRKVAMLRRCLVLLLVLTGLSMTTGDLLAQEGGDVPMFRVNATRTGQMPGPGPDPTNGVQVRLRFAVGDDLLSSPTVVDGVVYVGSLDGQVYALEAVQPALVSGGSAAIAEGGTALRGGPSETKVVRAELDAGTVVTITGEAEVASDGVEWWPVTVDDTGVVGWVKGEDLVAVFPDEQATSLAVETRLTARTGAREGLPYTMVGRLELVDGGSAPFRVLLRLSPVVHDLAQPAARYSLWNLALGNVTRGRNSVTPVPSPALHEREACRELVCFT